MINKRYYAGGAMMLMAAMAMTKLVTAQDRVKATSDDVPHYRVKQILGAEVGLEGNHSVGTVDDIVLDENGNVDYLIVMTSKDKLVTVPWDATRFNVDKRTAVVEIPEEQFLQAPTYTAQQYPTFSAPAYRTQVYRYYGLTPGQQRRAIRRGAVVVP
jgi:sporulation protein YlmC with PRC-barrel domain